jgi:hypothetical protein
MCYSILNMTTQLFSKHLPNFTSPPAPYESYFIFFRAISTESLYPLLNLVTLSFYCQVGKSLHMYIYIHMYIHTHTLTQRIYIFYLFIYLFWILDPYMICKNSLPVCRLSFYFLGVL